MLPTRTRPRIGGRTIAVLAALVTAAACGDSQSPGTTPPPPPAVVRAVRVTPEAPSAKVGDVVRLTATPVDANGNALTRPVTWRSLDPQVASIDASGVATALAAGEARLVATSDAVDGEARLSVSRRPVASIVLNATQVELDPAQSYQAVATVRDDIGGEVTDRVVTWQTTDASIVTVDPTGRLVAVGEGVAAVEAIIDGVRAQLAVTVRPVPVARIVLSATHVELEPGDEVRVQAHPVAADGRTLTNRLMMWGSSAPTTVEVLGQGLLRAHATGTGTITVASEGTSVQLTFAVRPRPPHPLVFDRVSMSGNEIFVQEAAGGYTRLNAGNVSRHPSASPDGQRFVFAVTQRDQTTNQIIHDLFAVDRNGMNIRHVTKLAGIETDPVWSPDGRRIAFAGTGDGDRASDIFVMNADGSGLVNLTADMPFTAEITPAWSPDGESIAFASVNLMGQSSIQTMRADGSSRRRITDDRATSSSHPTWAPEGGRIAFARSSGATGIDIVIVDADGSNEVHLALAGEQSDPVWSPDGEYFAFTGRAGTEQMVGTVRRDGSMLRLRTPGRNPAWLSRW